MKHGLSPWLRRNAWVIFAVLTLLFFGGSNFLSSVIGKEALNAPQAGRTNGQAQLLTEGVAGTVVAATMLAFRGAAAFRDARSIAALCVAGIILATGVLTLATALASDFRMAPFITGVLPINAVFLLLACRVLLGERNTTLQAAAIAVAVVGLAVMATADTSSEGLLGILYGLVVAVCFAAGNFGIKYASLRGYMDHIAAVSVLWISMGVVGLVFFAVECSASRTCLGGLDSFNARHAGGPSKRLYWFSAGSALLQTLAVGLMKVAVSLGPAAPAMAIANANAVAVLALNEIFFHSELEALQIVGLFISIGGIGALSVVPTVKAEDDSTTAMIEPASSALP